MRAAIFSEHGGPEVLRTAEVPSPEPGAGEVRIRVRASSLNHLDLWVRRGLPFPVPMPHIGGSDIAGEVDRVGPGAEGVPLGLRVVADPSLGWEWIERRGRRDAVSHPEFGVVGEHTQGGFAEHAVVPAANLVHLPDSVPFEVAAAAGLVSVTAWRALITRGRIRPGERVLITGGSGGVATAAVQVARRAGAEVHVVTSGAENEARVRALGAHGVVDRTAGALPELLRESLGRRGADLVLDSVGGALWEPLVKCLAPGGRLVTCGATDGPRPRMDLRHVFWKQLSILGTTMGSPSEFREVMALVFRGELVPVIHRTFPLEEIRAAHELLESGGVFGKVVLLI